MEKNVKVETYLTLRKEGLKKTQKKASEEAIAELGDEDGKEELYYPDSVMDVGEIYFEDGELYCGGMVSSHGEELGYFSPQIPLGNDTIIEIIDYYMDKMEKVKAVLEATK